MFKCKFAVGEVVQVAKPTGDARKYKGQVGKVEEYGVGMYLLCFDSKRRQWFYTRELERAEPIPPVSIKPYILR